MRYDFVAVVSCEMCGSGVSRHTVLGMRLNRSQGMNPRAKTGVAVGIKRCQVCGLVFSDPQPIPENISDHYGLPPETFWSAEYFKPNPDYFSEQIATAKRLLPFQRGMTALDVGAGIGKGMVALGQAGFDCYGLEPTESFYARALSINHIDPARLLNGDVETLDYPCGFFDLVTFGAVLEHLYHPATALERALRWVKPGGLIHIEVPSSKHLIASFLNLYYRLIGTTYVTHASPMHEPFHLYEFALPSFQRLGERLGFVVAEHRYDVCEIFYFPRFMHNLLHKIMEKTDTGMQLVVWLRKK